MRLRPASPTTPRAWTVELRPQTDGLALVCWQCPNDGGQITTTSARASALAHLARHARGDLRPPALCASAMNTAATGTPAITAAPAPSAFSSHANTADGYGGSPTPAAPVPQLQHRPP